MNSTVDSITSTEIHITTPPTRGFIRVLFPDNDFKDVLLSNNVEIIKKSGTKYKLKLTQAFTTENLHELLRNKYISSHLYMVRKSHNSYSTICILR